MYEMLRKLEPPVGFGQNCPYRLAYKKLIRMNMPLDSAGTVHFTTTLFALVRESLGIKMAPAEFMDIKDAELRETIKTLWPVQAKRSLDLLLPPNSEYTFTHLTVGKIYAGLLIYENWQMNKSSGNKKNLHQLSTKPILEACLTQMLGHDPFHMANRLPNCSKEQSRYGSRVDLRSVNNMEMDHIHSENNYKEKLLTYKQHEKELIEKLNQIKHQLNTNDKDEYMKKTLKNKNELFETTTTTTTTKNNNGNNINDTKQTCSIIITSPTEKYDKVFSHEGVHEDNNHNDDSLVDDDVEGDDDIQDADNYLSRKSIHSFSTTTSTDYTTYYPNAYPNYNQKLQNTTVLPPQFRYSSQVNKIKVYTNMPDSEILQRNNKNNNLNTNYSIKHESKIANQKLAFYPHPPETDNQYLTPDYMFNKVCKIDGFSNKGGGERAERRSREDFYKKYKFSAYPQHTNQTNLNFADAVHTLVKQANVMAKRNRINKYLRRSAKDIDWDTISFHRVNMSPRIGDRNIRYYGNNMLTHPKRKRPLCNENHIGYGNFHRNSPPCSYPLVSYNMPQYISTKDNADNHHMDENNSLSEGLCTTDQEEHHQDSASIYEEAYDQTYGPTGRSASIHEICQENENKSSEYTVQKSPNTLRHSLYMISCRSDVKSYVQSAKDLSLITATEFNYANPFNRSRKVANEKESNKIQFPRLLKSPTTSDDTNSTYYPTKNYRTGSLTFYSIPPHETSSHYSADPSVNDFDKHS
ncbi:hypothetical protein MN116_004004 [Schistosoma mekongi]|uniref:Voltage-dependent calcium channel alpha-1 subunit IQ domain-containing protein n=1 Tax=Schistosoma mekongi TaxID=38744 RepID=A0AAE1ZFA6_SCHME|nr:hypothetical protein MN116_004004 [Schistosoma mekongi]